MNSANKNAPEWFLITQAYHQIQNDIITGALQPGNPITMNHVNKQLKIETHTLNEVLQKLVQAGLITIYDDQTFGIVTITEEIIRDICTTLIQIEEIAIRQSIANATLCWENNIHKTLQALNNAVNQSNMMEFNLLVERNEDFHYAIVANCNSPALLELRTHLYLKYNTIVKLFIKSLPDKKYMIHRQNEHKMIAQAALNRDAKLTCSLNYYHIINSLQPIIDKLNKANSIKKMPSKIQSIDQN